MNSTDLLQLVDNLQQASEIHNLQQVHGIFGCVIEYILQCTTTIH